MQKYLWISIKLHSDLCAATGDGVAGFIDMDTAQENGLPVIPAKRLKGCLVKEALEQRDNGLMEPETFTWLFGEKGAKTGGAFRIEDARLYRIPEKLLDCEVEALTEEDYQTLQEEIKKQTELGEQEILELFTRLRTRTAIQEETQTARQGSLRTMRVVPKGITFRSRIIFCKELEDKHMKALSNCIKGVRHIGMGVTRGLGMVTCSVEQEKSEDNRLLAPEFLIRDCNSQEQVEQDFEIKLEEPIMLAGKKGLYEDCEDWITGSSVRGAFASMYLEDYKLGNQAEKDEDFSRIFLKEGVQFGFSFLKKGNRVFYPCPANLVKSKESGGPDMIFDRFCEVNSDRRRKDIRSLIFIENGEVCLEKPEKEMRMHHARPKDRGIGHALGERESESGELGQFYQYVSLKKGQSFQGSLRGKASDIKRLLECLEKRSGYLYLGRSKTAEYGKARFMPKEYRKPGAETEEEKCDTWILELLTPMVLYDWEKLRPDANPQLLCDLLNEKEQIGAELENQILKFTRTGGYNSHMRLPEAQMPALAAGTVLKIRTKLPVTRMWLEGRRFGMLTGSGYGMVKAIPYKGQPAEYKIADNTDKEGKKTETTQLFKAIIKLSQSKLEMQEQRKEALNTPAEPLNSTGIEQLISMLPANNENVYESMINQLENMGNQKKAEQMKQFIEPCKDKGLEFIKMYLEKEKWRARGDAGNKM